MVNLISNIPLRNIFGEFLVKNGEKYPNMVVLDADLSASTRTNKFGKKFPDRFFNMGIAEQNLVGTAMGFAISGKIPVVSGFSIFLTGRAWEFIRMACHDNLNIKFIATHAGFVGEDGSSHNALEDLSLMTTLPNMNVIVPGDNIELESILSFVLKNKGPYYIRLPRSSLPSVHDSSYKYSPSELDVIKEGSDICIIGIGLGTGLAMESCTRLEKKLGVSIKIINLSTVKPILSSSLISHTQNMKSIIVIEEHNTYCGVGSIISRTFSKKIDISINTLGVNNTFGESGPRSEVLKKYGFNYKELEAIIQKII